MLVPCFDCAVQPVWLALLFQACPRSTGMSHRWMGARASRAAMAASASVLSASANPGGPDVIVLTTSFNPPEAASQFNQHTSPRHLFFPSLSHPLSIIPSSFFSFSLSSLCYLLFPSEILPHSPILHPSRSVTTHTELSSASFAGLSGSFCLWHRVLPLD
ncbi:hypothetical protein B0J11DRAFT_57891 [Dendryphion nanum]|uniref:Uncharacterized protein n=1 Tax=Dendryphion nanum TaxID=256645 RepID=A0A9P9DIA1_9PLEO|nr:hypothetical protein B0J11DRAFT_57891 [Dendryphion nanum]